MREAGRATWGTMRRVAPLALLAAAVALAGCPRPPRNPTLPEKALEGGASTLGPGDLIAVGRTELGIS